MLLRVPAALAEQLHKQLAGNSSKDKDRGDEKDGAAAASSSSSSGPSLKLSFLGPDGGVLLQQKDSHLSGQLVNLPTMIEVHKTFDNIHYYKCADIAQMIVVQNAPAGAASNTAAAAAAAAHAPSSLNANPARPKNSNDPASAAAAVAPIPIDYPHGLTPPTRDIRPKRFDRDTKVPARIVGEVDTLMANIKDNKAVNYFELVEDEEEVNEEEEEQEEEEEMADEAAEEEEERRQQQQQQQQEDDERRRQRTDEPARIAQQSTSFQQAQKLLGTPAVHRGATPDVRAVAGTPFMAVSASPLRSSPLGASVFGASPAVHADTADMTDVSLDLFSQGVASSSAAAGSSSAASLQPVSSPSNLMSINVSGVEGMFGASPQQSQQQMQAAGSQPMDLASFLPETPHTPVQGGAAAAGFPSAAAAAAAPPSATDLVRAELLDVQSRISVAEKEIAESKNMLLKRKAEQRLQALQEEKRSIEAKL